MLTAIFLRRRPAVRLVAILLAFSILGAWRYAVHPYAACPSPVDLAFYNGDEKQAVWATVEGVVGRLSGCARCADALPFARRNP